MALVRRLYQAVTDGGVHPTQVDASWARVRTDDGDLLQISTYGSDHRASKPKVSQTIQIDEDRARELIAALKEVFGAQILGESSQSM
ncbi:hypothetical protein [Microbacterium sp. NC79]|uniref:hypothetical protein n=1 Tax=Microbacterium sp. NC79 TaxID=2851009 RepID=UPI001C2C38FA|nr:hypothetical protein [Microbacterium sp. NC79]MBV0895964.1 hypothetical protein [Microbacterium sp. NC79]